MTDRDPLRSVLEPDEVVQLVAIDEPQVLAVPLDRYDDITRGLVIIGRRLAN